MAFLIILAIIRNWWDKQQDMNDPRRALINAFLISYGKKSYKNK